LMTAGMLRLSNRKEVLQQQQQPPYDKMSAASEWPPR
jgi:hypothetical protein